MWPSASYSRSWKEIPAATAVWLHFQLSHSKVNTREPATPVVRYEAVPPAAPLRSSHSGATIGRSVDGPDARALARMLAVEVSGAAGLNETKPLELAHTWVKGTPRYQKVNPSGMASELASLASMPPTRVDPDRGANAESEEATA